MSIVFQLIQHWTQLILIYIEDIIHVKALVMHKTTSTVGTDLIPVAHKLFSTPWLQSGTLNTNQLLKTML